MNKNEAIFRLLVSAAKAALVSGGSITLEVAGRDFHLLPVEAYNLADKNPDVDPCPEYLTTVYRLAEGGVDSERVLLDEVEQVTVKFAR